MNISNIITDGMHRFYAEYGFWPHELIVGNKWGDPLNQYFNEVVHRFSGMEVIHSSKYDEFKLRGNDKIILS